MRLRALQLFFFANFFFLWAVSLLADLSLGRIYALDFVDVDGNTLSTSGGHVSVVVLTTLANLEKAQTVGDRVPDYCLGDPTYRMITVVKFKKHAAPVRMVLTAMARRRLDAEAKRLQSRYVARKIARDARRDIFAVVDFEGEATSQLGALPEPSNFHVFVFTRNGELLQQWNDVPSAEELAAVVK